MPGNTHLTAHCVKLHHLTGKQCEMASGWLGVLEVISREHDCLVRRKDMPICPVFRNDDKAPTPPPEPMLFELMPAAPKRLRPPGPSLDPVRAAGTCNM